MNNNKKYFLSIKSEYY